MLELMRRSLPTLILAIALALAGCDRKPESPLLDDDGILKFVPADTPYVFGNAEAPPEEFIDKIEPELAEILAAYRDMLRTVLDLTMAAGDGEADLDEEARVRINAVATELITLLSPEGLENAGFSRETKGMLYGNGLLPVLRLELADPALFEAAVARIESEVQAPLPTAELGDVRYRYFDGGELRVLLATIGNYAVVSVAPASFDDAQLRELLGMTLPRRNIAQSGELARIAEQHGFKPVYVGFLDATRIAERFLGEPAGLDAALLEAAPGDLPALSPVCKAELRGLVEVAPRMLVGYTEMNAERLSQKIIVELRSDIASGLKSLPVAVPGLGLDFGGLISIGMSMDPKAAREFYAARLEAVESQPFECELLEEFQAGIVGGRAILEQPIPPLVYDFRGFIAVIDDIEGMDLNAPRPPDAVDARFLLSIANAPQLVELGKMMSPELASLALQADGKPVRLDAAITGAVGETWVALAPSAIGLAVGENAEAELASLMDAETTEALAFFSMHMDADRYFEMMAESAEAVPEMPDAHAAAMQSASNQVLQAMRGLYDRVSLDVYFRDYGIEVTSVVTLSD